MNRAIDQIIDLENPEFYDCTVWKYQVGHSEMIVRLYSPEEKEKDKSEFYLIFQGVLFFEGPLKWKGASFFNGANEECQELLHRIGLQNAREAAQSGFYRLFKQNLSGLEVKIIAMKVIKTQNIT
jgi:hypothetical protein